jgi:hypothetical protein
MLGESPSARLRCLLCNFVERHLYQRCGGYVSVKDLMSAAIIDPLEKN